MTLSAFDDENLPPDPAAIDRVLGRSAGHWRKLIAQVAADHGPMTPHWHFGGPKFGWSLRLKRADRIVVYLIPQARQFLAGVVLGEKAARRAPDMGCSKDVLAIIDAAPRYAEGRGIRIPVATARDVATIVRLIALKMGT